MNRDKLEDLQVLCEQLGFGSVHDIGGWWMITLDVHEAEELIAMLPVRLSS